MKYTRYLDHLEDRDAALHPSSTQTTPDWCPACLPGGKLRPITMDMNGAPNLIHPWQQARRSTPLPIPQIGKLPQSLPEKGILCSASGCDGLGRVVWVEITPFRAVRKRHTNTPARDRFPAMGQEHSSQGPPPGDQQNGQVRVGLCREGPGLQRRSGLVSISQTSSHPDPRSHRRKSMSPHHPRRAWERSSERRGRE